MTTREALEGAAEICNLLAQDWLERCAAGTESRGYEDAVLLDAAHAILALRDALPEDTTIESDRLALANAIAAMKPEWDIGEASKKAWAEFRDGFQSGKINK